MYSRIFTIWLKLFQLAVGSMQGQERFRERDFEGITISLTIYLLYNLVRLQTFTFHDLRPSLQTSTAQSGIKGHSR